MSSEQLPSLVPSSHVEILPSCAESEVKHRFERPQFCLEGKRALRCLPANDLLLFVSAEFAAAVREASVQHTSLLLLGARRGISSCSASLSTSSFVLARTVCNQRQSSRACSTCF